MNYKKLADEYLQEAQRLSLHIANIKKHNKFHMCIYDRSGYYRVKKLYGMYLDLKHVGEYLINKYGGIE